MPQGMFKPPKAGIGNDMIMVGGVNQLVESKENTRTR
jgi:hypothetical protein